MPAILFGSISTIADTYELQREAFNHAFDDHGLSWRLDFDQCVEMLSGDGDGDGDGGGAGSLRFARSAGQIVDVYAPAEAA